MPLRTGGSDSVAAIEGPRPYVRHPLPHHRPQYIGQATLKRGRRGWNLVYNFPVAFNLFEMGIVIPIPEEFTRGLGEALDHLDGLRVNAYVRQYVNAARSNGLSSTQEDSEEHHDGQDEGKALDRK